MKKVFCLGFFFFFGLFWVFCKTDIRPEMSLHYSVNIHLFIPLFECLVSANHCTSHGKQDGYEDVSLVPYVLEVVGEIQSSFKNKNKNL